MKICQTLMFNTLEKIENRQRTYSKRTFEFNVERENVIKYNARLVESSELYRETNVVFTNTKENIFFFQR